MFEVLPSLKFLYKCHCTLHLNLASEMDPKFTLYLNCFILVLLVGAFSVITNLRMELFEALDGTTTSETALQCWDLRLYIV